MNSATGSDLRWWAGVFGGFLLAALIVYAAAFQMPPAGWHFSGFLLNSGDAWSYQASVRSFAEGGLLIDNPFSTTVREPAFFNLLWFFLGKIKRVTGLPFLPLYYGFGVLAVGLMYWVILLFSREFAGRGARGRFAFLLASLGGGLGWITLLMPGDMVVKLRPADLYFPEGYPLQSALFMPHFALSIALVGMIMLWFQRGVSTGRRIWSVGAALLTLGLSFFHPYHLVTVGCVAGAWVAVEQALDRRRFHRGWMDLGLMAVAVLPAAFYYRWLFRQPNWSMWAVMNVVRTNGVWAVLLGLGFLILLAAVGIWRRGIRKLDDQHRFLSIWALVGIGLLSSYPLFKFEGKLIEGLILPLSILGADALFSADDVAGKRWRWMAAAGVLLLLSPSHVALVSQSLKVAGRTWDKFFPFNWMQGCTLTDGEIELNRYLEKHSLAGSLIMVLKTPGCILPGVTDARMFISGNPVTPEMDQHWKDAKWFYLQSGQSAERHQLLRQHGITHVWYRPGRGVVFDPMLEPYLEPVFVAPDVGLWRVKP